MNGERQAGAAIRSMFGVGIVVAALGVGGCISDDPPAAAQLTINDYGQPLSEEMQRRLWVAAKIRALDPCGFLDPAQVGELGAVAQFGPDPYNGPGSCRAGVAPPGLAPKSFGLAEISIDLEREAPEAGAVALTEDGLVYADEMYDGGSLGCGRLIRLDIPEARDTSGRSVDGAFMSVVAQGFGRSPDGDDPQRDCEIADRLTEGIVELIRGKQPPQRVDADIVAPLGDRTSCDLFEHLPQDYRVENWVPTSSPYLCDFDVAGPGIATGDGSVRALIDTRIVTEAVDPGPLEQDMAPTRRPVDGRPVLLLTDGDSCRARLPVGEVVDGNRSGFELDEHETDLGRVRTVVELEGACSAVQPLLPAMVATFG
ncbi:hypothetical protein [Nocardia cyriacigeorgica]|uniref:hypothetical protein n=1 Tax=Nocardia cyriacigeorgica TaxID=135487 RepID=UPI00189434C9|nr:hypothetical protein [Nocardia cyriacigeorgica]MBF6411688.1 hypothetical protein [Nocardia cyriacigeorgica]